MPRNRVLRLTAGALVVIAALLAFAPFLQIALVSLGAGSGGLAAGPPVSLSGYSMLLRHPWLLPSLLMTVAITGCGTTVSIFATTLASYGLSRRGLPGKELLRLAVYIPLLVSAGLIPLYVTVRRLGMIDTFWALILPFSINLVNLHVMVRYFEGAEMSSYEEAAALEGAGAWRILWSVALPSAAPAVITVGLFYAIAYWNSWFPAFIFASHRSLYPYQLIVRELTASSGNTLATGMGATSALTASIPAKMAAVVLGAFPALPFVLVAQGRLRQTNLLSGLR